jgi:hypothetical protein
MALGDIAGMMEEKNAGAVRVPDLDWLMLNNEDTKNIPTPHNVEIVPQLQETWGNTDASSARLISNQVKSESLPSEKIASEDISGVINTAKKEMMLGLNGKNLSKKLASTYPKNLLVAAKEELTKLAQEQGLLGSVYVDLSPFDSCEHAARVLGRNKIRLAKYVVGEPKRSVCSSHRQGHCKALGKYVIDEVDYNSKLLSDYTNHLHIAGILDRGETVSSKDGLREALLKSAAIREPEAHEVPTVEEERPMNIESSFGDLQDTLLAEAKGDTEHVSEFDEVRPVLAFIQNEMLKGKMGSDLKEAISKNIAQPVIEKFANQIKKAVSLQGLLGNVYVDVSYYNGFDESVKAIKTASTSPSYVVHTEPHDDLDDLLERVAAVTGCEILPRDGKIKEKVASSYIDDLQFSSRVSSDTAQKARNRIEAGDNVLGVLRDIYMSSMSYIPPKREGGQPGRFHQNVSRKYANREKLKGAAYKAVEAGFPIEKIEKKLMEEIPTAEAVGMVRKVLASVKEVDANVLTNCTTEKYQFSHDARLKKASKCDGCVRFTCAGCTALGLRFASDSEEGLPAIDPKTEKVLFEENPDVLRENLNKEFDMPNYSGANINVDLEKMRSSEASDAVDVDTTFNMEGMDEAMKDM